MYIGLIPTSYTCSIRIWEKYIHNLWCVQQHLNAYIKYVPWIAVVLQYYSSSICALQYCYCETVATAVILFLLLPLSNYFCCCFRCHMTLISAVVGVKLMLWTQQLIWLYCCSWPAVAAVVGGARLGEERAHSTCLEEKTMKHGGYLDNLPCVLVVLCT